MLDMISAAAEKGSFLDDLDMALLAVLPKPYKDPTVCSSYRPLSILCAEAKAYAKALASRIEPHMTKLVHYDQTGFMKSLLAGDNISRLLHEILKYPVLCCHAMKRKPLISLSGNTFIQLVKILYANPSAMVTANNIPCTSISISRGSHQGCPLCPFLFSLSLEPLAQSMRQHPLIEPSLFCTTICPYL